MSIIDSIDPKEEDVYTMLMFNCTDKFYKKYSNASTKNWAIHVENKNYFFNNNNNNRRGREGYIEFTRKEFLSDELLMTENVLSRIRKNVKYRGLI